MSKNKILCVIDAQNDFINGVLGTKEAQEAVLKVVELINNWNGVIIATKDTHDSKTYASTKEGRNLPTLHCIKGQKGWDFDKDVETALSNAMTYPVIEKSTFGTMEIISSIKKHCKMFNVDENSLIIEVAGFCTDICVITNALLIKTAFPEAEVIVESSCCAGTSPSFHKAALVSMKSCQIIII